MENRPVRVAVVGLGMMGQNHVRKLTEIPEATLVAVCDSIPSLVAATVESTKTKGYTDLAALLDEVKPDAVHLIVPTSLHVKLGRQILAAGAHLLVEKPIAHSVGAANELIDAARQAKKILAVGHVERFNPALQVLWKMLESGEFGNIRSINSRRVSPFPARIQDANVLLDLAVHDIDAICWLLGQNPRHVQVRSGRTFAKDRDDQATLLLDFEEVSATVEVNWITPLRLRQLTLTGDKGYAELDFLNQTLRVAKTVLKTTGTALQFEPAELVSIAVEKGESLKAEIQDFLDCVRTGKNPLVSGEAGRDALAAVLAAVG